MNNCKQCRRQLLDYVYGELNASGRRETESHLKSCPRCREELENIRRFLHCADSFGDEIQEAASQVDWDDLAEKAADKVFIREKSSQSSSAFKRFLASLAQPRFRPVYAALFAGVILGGLLTMLVFRGSAPIERENNRMVIPAGFVESMDMEMARRQTLDYLEQSQYLLLDFVQSSPEQLNDYGQNPFTLQKTRDLLAKKRYLNPKLDSLKMAKAKAVCDQIEFLFYELAEISRTMTAEELASLQNLIKEKQVLLKINLVREELQKSEV